MPIGSWFSTCQELIEKTVGKEQLKVTDEEEIEPGQDHVFTFYDQLSKEHKAQLDEDFDGVRVEEMEEAWNKALQMQEEFRKGLLVEGPHTMNWELKKPPVLRPGANLTKLLDVGERKVASWRQVGLELYHKARVAIVIFSGGMDSRIGEGLPKGTMDIGLLSHKSIFQLYIERVRRLQHLVYRKYRRATHIPVYIMCNRQNRHVIEVFFRENEFFGMREQDLMLFTQGMAPMVDRSGKFLLAEKHRIAMYPNGNGGVFRALMEQGMVSDMKSRGVTRLFMCSIDNLLAKVGDPIFVGLNELSRTEVGIKTVEKLNPDELFGVFCTRKIAKQEDADGDGKLDLVMKVKSQVLEFFEIPEDLRRRRIQMTNGLPPLALGVGNLSQYYFKVDFVKRAHASSSKKWHLISKNIPHVDMKTGLIVKPPRGDRNGYRMELFVFDSFEHTKSVVGLQVERDECGLVKNLQGLDSPATALQAMGKLHQSWILAAGGVFEESRQSTEREDSQCEISPLVSFAGEDLEGQFPEVVKLPFYLPSQQELLEFSAASSAQTRRPSTHYLDWYSDLAQRELQVELQGKLGPIMEMIEDPARLQYSGERAEVDEALPPTPRMEDGDGLGGSALVGRRKGKGKGKGRIDDKDEGGSQGSSPRDGDSPRAQEKAEKLKTLTAGAPPGRNKTIASRGGTSDAKESVPGGKKKPAGGAGGQLSLPKTGDKKREDFWA
mmetsp:Transcript_166824/g.530363  ORF Transcript_166824/g.530363 Transcript_166824/m.530363 type:complete len:719 (-) Transcript_166824:115-2271(-)